MDFITLSGNALTLDPVAAKIIVHWLEIISMY